MARYTGTNTRKTKGQKHYSTTVYNKVEKSDTDMYFIAQEGDRCDNLAQRFYNNTNLWWFIARVNNLKTNNIPAGTSLRIPIKTDSAIGT